MTPAPPRPRCPQGDRPPRPLVIGLLGGVGAGKSTVARLLAARGALVADADRFCHEALADPALRPRLVALFGPEVLDARGRVVRERLRRVFENPAALRRLEELLHPIARRRTEAVVARARAEDRPAVVVDAPLLLEAGLHRLCHCLVFLDAPAAVRRERAAARGIPPADWARREARQWPLERKRARADHVLPTGGGLGETEQAVARLWRRLFTV